MPSPPSYIKRGPFQRRCAACSSEFSGTVNQKYCSSECRPTYKKLYPGLAPGTVGAVSELIACADLLVKGYEVFRAVSPSCSCDLIALRGSEVKRVEVRTEQGGSKSVARKEDSGKQDHFAVVTKNRVIYIPELT